MNNIEHPLDPTTHAVAHLPLECRACGQSILVSLPLDAYEAWVNGTLLQVAWPEGDTDSREMLISRTCSTCWDEIFGPLEEE